jgi:hypothetical protein
MEHKVPVGVMRGQFILIIGIGNVMEIMEV